MCVCAPVIWLLHALQMEDYEGQLADGSRREKQLHRRATVAEGQAAGLAGNQIQLCAAQAEAAIMKVRPPLIPGTVILHPVGRPLILCPGNWMGSMGAPGDRCWVPSWSLTASPNSVTQHVRF